MWYASGGIYSLKKPFQQVNLVLLAFPDTDPLRFATRWDRFISSSGKTGSAQISSNNKMWNRTQINDQHGGTGLCESTR